MTKAHILSGNLILGANVAISPITLGVVDIERTELFLDQFWIESLSGISITINSPTKSGSNPLEEPSGANTATWDYDKNWCCVIYESSTFKMWMTALPDDADGTVRISYMTSSNGTTWTKPILGLITYDGDTDNNLCIDDKASNPTVVLNPGGAAGEEYVLLSESKTGETPGVFLYKSANGTTWTYVKEVDGNGYEGAINYEGKCLVERPDGRWLIYYTKGHAGNDRSTHAMLSRTTDPLGDWDANGGKIIPALSANDQMYGPGIHIHEGNYLAFMSAYNAGSGMINVDLYNSRDGFFWTKIKDTWIANGTPTSWDDGMILIGKNLINLSNVWYYFYTGTPSTHGAAQPHDNRMGLATIGYERIGSIGATGNLVTEPIRPAADLHVNVDASGGSLKVELLNANDDSVLGGFSEDDFDTISSDTYDTTCQWGGVGVPLGKEIKLKFYLSSATLYSYWVRS